MNTSTIKLTSLALVASFSFSSCATTKDGRVTQAQGTGLGALLGGGLGYALGGSRGALIGAALGAAGGFAFGTQVASKKAQYAKQEDFLDYAVAQAEKSNADAVAANQKLASEVQQLEQRSRSLPDPKAKQTWSNDAQIRLSAIDKQSTKLDTQIKDYNACLDGEGYGNKSQSAALRSKIKGLESQKTSLLKYKTRLASAQTRIAI